LFQNGARPAYLDTVTPPVPNPTPVPIVLNTYVAIGNTNIRSGPGVSYNTIGSIPQGKQVYSYAEVSPDGVYFWAKISPDKEQYACIKIQPVAQILLKKV
jgi:uncharacterized protein YgiM (DUF1202 family)